MLSTRSVDYFRDVLNSALNYFGREQKAKKKRSSTNNGIDSTEDDLIEIIPIDQTTKTDSRPSLHNTYRLFYRKLPASVARDTGIKQTRIREYYKDLFDEKTNPLPKAILQLNSSENQLEEIFEEEIREALQHDAEENFETMDENDDGTSDNHADLLQTLASINDEEHDEDLDPMDIDDENPSIMFVQHDVFLFDRVENRATFCYFSGEFTSIQIEDQVKIEEKSGLSLDCSCLVHDVSFI